LPQAQFPLKVRDLFALIGYQIALLGDPLPAVRQLPPQLFVVEQQTLVLALQLVPASVRRCLRWPMFSPQSAQTSTLPGFSPKGQVQTQHSSIFICQRLFGA
jgi:hypothetical protein